MKKKTQFLCISLLCGLSILVSGCGIRPSKLESPSQVEHEKNKADGQAEATNSYKPPQFPDIYPKAAR